MLVESVLLGLTSYLHGIKDVMSLYIKQKQEHFSSVQNLHDDDVSTPGRILYHKGSGEGGSIAPGSSSVQLNLMWVHHYV